MSAEVQNSIVLESRPCSLGCPASDEVVLTGGDHLHHLPVRFTIVRFRIARIAAHGRFVLSNGSLPRSVRRAA